MDFSSNGNSGDSNNRNHGPPSRNGFNQNSSIDNNSNGNGNANHYGSNNSPLNFSFQEARKQMKDFKKSIERLESRINNVNSRMDSFMYIIILMGVVIIINNCQLVYILINK